VIGNWAALLPVAPRCDDGLCEPFRLVVQSASASHSWRWRHGPLWGGAAAGGRYRIRAAWDRGIAAAQRITSQVIDQGYQRLFWREAPPPLRPR
jgi:hypothetical protein